MRWFRTATARNQASPCEAYDRIGRRVLLSAIIAWPIFGAVSVVHLLFDPLRSETGSDIVTLVLAIPGFLYAYGFWMGLIYAFRRHSTRDLELGFLIHIAGAVLALTLFHILE